MRIIAGLAKGRNINSPISQVRPTSDRARRPSSLLLNLNLVLLVMQTFLTSTAVQELFLVKRSLVALGW